MKNDSRKKNKIHQAQLHQRERDTTSIITCVI
jgi:hypothetical protein